MFGPQLFDSSCRYILLLSQHPWVILLSSGLLSILSIICSLTLQDLPDFSDPQEVRLSPP